jgi:hypothetical protein
MIFPNIMVGIHIVPKKKINLSRYQYTIMLRKFILIPILHITKRKINLLILVFVFPVRVICLRSGFPYNHPVNRRSRF